MFEDTTTEFRREGESPFETDNDKDKSEESSTEETNTEEDPSPEGEKSTQEEKEQPPFKDHPRWKEREEEWNTRFNSQESRHAEDIRKLREEFGGDKPENKNTEIPAWFGGNQAAWDAYRSDRDAELAGAVDAALSKITTAKTDEEKAVAEATVYMQTELQNLENDKELNPDSLKINAEELLQIVIDNDLIDTKGRWNYKAGFKIYKASAKPVEKKVVTGNKELAAATTSDSKGEQKPQPFKTTADFKKNRPW